MANIADFHTHTCYSDGDLLPGELVRLARTKGLKTLSITDHDTVEGLFFAEKECNKQNIRFIPGIEFSTETEFTDLEVHILGYGIDPQDSGLLRMTDHAKENAKDYCFKVCSNLESHGWDIDHSVIDNAMGIITKHDITKAVTNKETSNYDFHNIWLSEESILDVTMQRFPAKKAIRTIHRAGGKAICAHLPRTLEQSNGLPLLPYVAGSLISDGLDGFEVFYANSSKEQISTMYEMCVKQELMMTGGSDFHGPDRTKRCQLGEYNSNSMFKQQELFEQLTESVAGYSKQKVLA